MEKVEELDLVIQGLATGSEKNKMNCQAERHHYSMFNVRRSMFSLFSVRCSVGSTFICLYYV